MLRAAAFRRNLPWILVAVVAAVVLIAGVVGIARAALPAPLVQRYANAAPAATPSATPAPTPTPTPGAAETAQMAALAAALPPGSVSVAAQNLSTGATFAWGSTGGQITASIVKVDILETLLLQKQAAGTTLTTEEAALATSMIEDSDDDAATDLWEEVGGGSAVAAANAQLGVPCTVPGSEDYWGLTTTCAQGQLRLLDMLVSTNSLLQTPRRDYELSLMQSVTQSQTWGVPAAADPGSTFAVKNGWLNLEGDTDWAINSDGIVTYHGQAVLLSVLTQHNATMDSGVQLIQSIAPLAAQAVTSP